MLYSKLEMARAGKGENSETSHVKLGNRIYRAPHHRKKKDCKKAEMAGEEM